MLILKKSMKISVLKHFKIFTAIENHFDLIEIQWLVSRRPRKVFAPGKQQQNLEPCDYRTVLFTQEISGVCTSPFLDTDELKMASRARKVSGAFEKRAPVPTEQYTVENKRKSQYRSYPFECGQEVFYAILYWIFFQS